MTKKTSWLVAYLCSIYLIYSQLIVIFSLYLYGKSLIESGIVIITAIVIAMLVARQNIIGVALSVLFPITVICLIVSGGIIPGFPGVFNEMITTSGLLTCITLLGFPLLPSVALGIIIFNKIIKKDKDTDLIDQSSLEKRTLLKSMTLYIYLLVMIGFFYATSFAQRDTKFYIVFSYNTVMFFLILYYGYFLLKGNEMARKIQISFPITLLFVILIMALGTFVNLVSGNPWDGITLVINILFLGTGFVFLFPLSLVNYNWKKKMLMVETITNIGAKDDSHND